LAQFQCGEPIRYKVWLRADRAIERLRVSMTIFARDGTAVGSSFSPELEGAIPAGTQCEIRVVVPFDRLAPGSYYCGLSVGAGSNRTSNIDYDVVTNTLHFEVLPAKSASGTQACWVPSWGSVVLPDLAVTRTR
jgi:hypothetical protein